MTLAYTCCSQLFNGLALSKCFGGSQVVDLLDAGRGKVSWKDITED